MMATPFHLSLPCTDVQLTKVFYTEQLGFKAGRSTHAWVDINVAGNQITFLESSSASITNSRYKFEGNILPIFHFGIILSEQEWNGQLKNCTEAGIITEAPQEFLTYQVGAHKSFFVTDPNGYSIEFKQFITPSDIFES